MERTMIELHKVNKWYDKHHVLKDVNLTINRGEHIVLCGPSGSGKSTLIRCINHLEQIQEGDIVVNGVKMGINGKNVNEIRRDVGMVFQQFNLFPHLTVLENCMLAPLRVKGMFKKEAREVAMQYLKKVHIDNHAHKYPAQLSGGQQQRVAIAARSVYGTADHVI